MKKILCLILTVVVFILVTVSSNLFVYASENNTFSITDETLYNLTNTYNYNSKHEEYESHYFMNTKNNVVVSNDAPLMTVFTHGLGGDASNWSNNGSVFAYSKDSLITRLAKLIDSNIYWVTFENFTEFEIYNITTQVYNGIYEISSEVYNKTNKETNINDISKHTIIVFEAYSIISNGANEGVYEQFNYAISKIVYDISQLNNCVLPTINLIGHSRGGITNIQYALDHPDLVNSIYSLGTPYTGSTSASVDLHIIGSYFSTPEAEADITNKEVYGKYMDRWNDNYDELYSNINVMALGGYSTLLGLSAGLTSEASLKFFEESFGIDRNIVKYVIPSVLGAIDGALLAQYLSPMGITKAAIGKLILGALSELATNFDLSSTAIDDIVQILTNEINLDYHFPFVSWYNDCLVDLGSQLGYEGLVPLDGYSYKGFNRKIKAFTASNSNFDALSMSDMPAVVHNLEARDKELGSYILSDICLGFHLNNEYEYYINSDNTITISAYIGNTTETNISIPGYIEGKEVTAISDSAFSNNLYGNTTVSTIIIPNTIETIGSSAFSNCTNLETIIFSNNSSLKEISENAFDGCSKLSNISIPMTVEKIGDYAFSSCTSLSGLFVLPDKLNDFGENVFSSTNISGVSISNDNTKFSVSDETLYDKSKTKLILSYKSGSFTVPITVSEISSYAFSNNTNITTINLNNVIKIGDFAFLNCTNMATVSGGDKIEEVNIQAFTSTKWIENNDIVILGTVLLKYNSENEIMYEIPQGIKYIGEFAFESKTLSSVYINSNVETISNFAFTNCPNLTKVYLLSANQPIIYPSTFIKKDNLVIYVPGLYEDDYINNSFYANYVNNIYSKWVTVKLYDGVNLYKSTALKYYSIIQNLSAPEKEGYEFIGWYSNITNKIYSEGTIFDLYDNNVTLTAVYEVSQYILYLNYNEPNSEIQALDISYGEMIEFPVPVKEGYTFNGWYDGPNSSYKKYSDGNGNAIVAWDKCEDAVLYAVFDQNQYTISYLNNGGENSIQNPETFYSDEVVILKNPTKYGYKFDGWTINGIKTNIIEAGTYENITAVANWIGTEIYTNNSTTQYEFTDQYVLVNIDNLSTSNEINFIIENSVLQVTFICGTNQTYNAHITIENRNLDLVINLKNIKFNSPNNNHTIDASEGQYTLYLNCSGENELYGGNGTVNEKNASYGICAYKLIINGGRISITGGNGYDGVDGINGNPGIDSDDNPDGWFLNPETGGNGTDGGDGTNGTSGGNGGFAVYTTSTFAYSNCEVTFTGGNGGRGGNGGNGGTGGAGASDTSANIITGVGDPGNGGDGGNGGNGGNSGVGSPAVNTNFNLGIFGSDGIPGSKGLGGAGGTGGDAGSYGEDGADGEDGQVGEPGYLEVTLYKSINCDSSSEYVEYDVLTQKKIVIELTVQCTGYYNIESNSTSGTSLSLYDENGNEIEITGYILVNNGNDILIYPYLNVGKYYIEVILNKNNDDCERITVTFDSRITKSSYVYLNNAVNILTHKHNEVQNYSFYASTSGFYYVKLTATSQYNVIYNEETIQVLYGENRIQKFVIEGYNNEAFNVANSNVIVFYAEKGKTYTIKINFSDYTVDTLNLKICNFEPIEVYNNEYTGNEPVRYGDNFKLWNVTESGTYNLSTYYYGTATENTPFYILKLTDDSIEILGSGGFSYYNNEQNIQFNVDEGDIIYFGYLNCTANGALVIQLEKYVSETFDLITDPNENVSVGSEVLINGGDYGGHVITVGYTRICYLSSSAPDTTSRLNYEWHSSNEEIAIVSDYGTITAICPGRVFITATYKNDNTIVGIISIDVVPYTGTEDVYLNYGMDVRVGGTTSGTEVTSGSGNAIEVSNSPEVTIHVYKTRLICLGEDSPSTSIQDFIWESNNTSIATVSAYGTITAKQTGTVTIIGTYKYNPYYKVVIVIEVIS